MYKKSLPYFLFALVFLAGAIFLGNKYSDRNMNDINARVTEILNQKERSAETALSFLAKKFSEYNNPDSIFSKDLGKFKLDGIEMLVLQDMVPVFWTENYVPFDTKSRLVLPADTAVELSNGIYQVISQRFDSLDFLAIILVKSKFPHENDFLENSFQKDFGIANGIEITFNKNGNDIANLSGKYLFSLQYTEENQLTRTETFILFSIYFASFLLFIAALYCFYKRYEGIFGNALVFNLIFSVDLLILRALLYYFSIPHILYESKLFSANYYASSILFPSLGDLFVNVIILLIIAFLMFRSLNFDNVKPGRWKYVMAVLLVFSFSVVFKLIEQLIGSIILDSDIEFGISNIFDLGFTGFMGLTTIAALLLIFFILSSKLLEFYTEVFFHKNIAGISLLILIALSSMLVFPEPAHLYAGLFLVYMLVLYFSIRWKKQNYPALIIFSILVLFSFATTLIINKYREIRTLENQQLIVEKIKRPYDPVLEYLYANNKAKIAEVRVDWKESDKEDIESLLASQTYNIFSQDIWQNYDLFITVCYPDKDLLIQPEDIVINCTEYFRTIAEEMGEPTTVSGFYLMEENSLNESYLGIMKKPIGDDTVHIYIEILSKFIPDGLGYPELLVNKENELNPFIKNHSIAKYINGNLVYRFGNYQYSINISNYQINNKIPYNITRNGFDHFFYPMDDDTVLVISKESLGFLEFIAPFSYLLIIFSLFLLLFAVVTQDLKKFLTTEPTLRKRLQYSIVSVVLVSFLFIGALSVWYVIDINSDKNLDILKEKSHSVLIELEHKLSDYEELTPDIYPYIYEILGKFSQVFFSDINLYDLDGLLIASSRPNIFEEGLISSRIDELAYKRILVDHKMLYIQREKIGSYEYLSAYVPFRNAENKIIAVLNLPYFAKQDELKTEISTFLTAFINIYIIIFVIAVIITILISQNVTRPLVLLRSKIGKIQLGKTNEKILWHGNDEIAGLVHEYNRMIDELEKNAELLARSERESAWREMAKQVAHEIKNPLTPMKLSIQHLKRMIHDRSDDWEKQFDRISSTLIEQIDSLSTIAGEFSDFAKMPLGKKEKTELCSILNSSLSLFENISEIEFNKDFAVKEPCYVKADKKQLIRAFNNLIENSVQAIENEEEKNISIALTQESDQYRIIIKDTGTGIDPALGDQIFSPRFTTKTSGMGLGLAMVRSIIQDSGGSIKYQSELGKGTSFIIDLPKISEEKQ